MHADGNSALRIPYFVSIDAKFLGHTKIKRFQPICLYKIPFAPFEMKAMTLPRRTNGSFHGVPRFRSTSVLEGGSLLAFALLMKKDSFLRGKDLQKSFASQHIPRVSHPSIISKSTTNPHNLHSFLIGRKMNIQVEEIFMTIQFIYFITLMWFYLP